MCKDGELRQAATADRAGGLFQRSVVERNRLAPDHLRLLLAGIALATQRERCRTADVLREDVQQLLIATQVQIGLLEDQVESEESPDVQESLDQLRSMTSRAFRSVRALAVDLTLPVASERSFAAAIDWLAFQMQEVHGLHVGKDLDACDLGMSRDACALLLDFVRELTLNVARHADVTEAALVARSNANVLRVSVIDEGVGFDVRRIETRDASRTSLVRIRECLALMGGRLEVSSAKNAGTCATIEFPLSDASGIRANPYGNPADTVIHN